MKFSIARDDFIKPLQLVVGVVERRQTLPILSNVLISITGDKLALTGTDLEIEIVGQLSLSTPPETAGDITVPARKLMDICRSLPEGATLDFAQEDSRVIMKSGRSRFTLSSLPASDFPNVEEAAASCEFCIEQSTLKHLIDGTAFAMAQQDVRYYLNGMLLEVGEGLVRAVATDGHRLAMKSLAVPVASGEKQQAIVPRKGILELARLLSDEGEVTVMLGTNHLRVCGDNFQFTTKLVDGAYPDYQRVLPKGGDKLLSGPREDLRQAFSRTAILSNEKYRGVRLLMSQGQLTLTANNPEQEEAQEDIAVDYQHGDLEIGFNVSYVIDVLNVLRGDQVRFTLSDANSSALVEDPSDDQAVYVVMPMRL